MSKSILGILAIVAYLAVSATIYFASAGRTDLPLAWYYFGFNLALGLGFSMALARSSPDLIAERIKPGHGEQDHVFKIASTILTTLMMVLAGLDVGHYRWTAPVAPSVQIAALVATLLGYAFISWGVLSNRFFLRPCVCSPIVNKWLSTRDPTPSFATPAILAPSCICA